MIYDVGMSRHDALSMKSELLALSLQNQVSVGKPDA